MTVRPSCGITACERPHLARGFCRAHYLRWRRTGDAHSEVPVAARGGSGSRRALLRQVRAVRGPATGRLCATCSAPAWCWTAAGAAACDPAEFAPSCRSCLRRTTGRAAVVDVERATRLYRAGATARGIGSVLGVSSGAVLRALRAHGVAIRPGGRIPPAARIDPAPKPHPIPRPISTSTTPIQDHTDHHHDHTTSTEQQPQTTQTRTKNQLLKDPRTTTRPLHPDPTVGAASPEGPAAPGR